MRVMVALAIASFVGINFSSIDWWPLTERASWVAVIVAGVIGLIQLQLVRHDQKRIAQDIARRPRLEVGFLPMKKNGRKNIPSPTMQITPVWLPGQEMSEPVAVHIFCCNNGNRTAREVLYNISVQQDFAMSALNGSKEGKTGHNPITDLDFWSLKDDYIHSYDMAGFEATVGVRRGRKEVHYPVEVSYDYGSLDTELTILVDSGEKS